MTTPATMQSFASGERWSQTSSDTWVISAYSIDPHREIADLKARLAETERQRDMWQVLATTDSLTGLYNRLKLDKLNEQFHKSPREHKDSNKSVSLLFIDLDKFGTFNKVYGDAVGDMVLRKLGEAINGIIRDQDLAIRKGGDEFAIFLRGSDYMTAYKTVVQRLEHLLTHDFHVEINGEPVQIRGSIGAFPYNADISPLRNIEMADASMRKAKERRLETAIDYTTGTGQSGVLEKQMPLPGMEPG